MKEANGATFNFFIEDSKLYLLWVYSRPDFYPREYFQIDAITPERYSDKSIFNFLRIRLELAGVPFDNFKAYNGNDYQKMGLPPSDEKLQDKNDKAKKAIRAAAKKFKSEKFGLNEIDTLLPYYYDLLSHFYLRPSYTQEQLTKIRSHIDEYIDLFLNSELFVYNKNYFTFEKQKQVFIERLRKMAAFENYGSNFIVTEIVKGNGKLETQDGFLFIHTLYALQKLNYIGVIRLWHEHRDVGYALHANIVVFDSLVEEVSGNYRKENPQNIIEKFDGKNGLLKFAGQEIELSKNGKQTDAVLLMQTLMKTKGDAWTYNDEILSDWGYNDDDQKSLAKNKVYFAGQKINAAVAMKTKIDDFIECNTSKARINPKYKTLTDN